MTESHIALPETFEFFSRKDFGNKAVAFVVRKNTVAVDNYSAGFLPSVLKGVKPVKKLMVIRSDTRDPEWRREFATPVTDFAETLPARITAFEGMADDPMFGRVLLVSYADGTEDRVACPYDGIFIKR